VREATQFLFDFFQPEPQIERLSSAFSSDSGNALQPDSPSLVQLIAAKKTYVKETLH
jgi:hypothetical protein